MLGTFCRFYLIELHLCLPLNQVKHFVNHAAHCRSIFQLNGVVHTTQAQTANTCTMRLLGSDDAFHQRHFQCFCLCHDYPVISSTLLPRFAAISAGEFNACKPFRVARTTLYGLLEPIHLASTLRTPDRLKHSAHRTTSNNSSTVGSWHHNDLGCTVTTDHRVMQRTVLQVDLNHLATDSSIAFCTATGTSLDFPLPMPTRPSPSPTTVSAAKPMIRPPFTTLVTRFTAIIFSMRPSPRSSCC